MAYHDNSNGPYGEPDQVVARASYDYYRALLWGSSSNRRQQFRQAWVCSIQKQWPDLMSMSFCERCFSVGATRCVLSEERRRMIAEAAYYRAEHRGFYDGNPIQDWLEAESEIDRRYFKIPGYVRDMLFHDSTYA